VDVVTGAFSYTGRAVAEELLRRGRRVRTLTRRNAPHDPLRDRIEQDRLQFRDRAALAGALAGADTLYNTYWIRFEHSGRTFAEAVRNTTELFAAAGEAGVRRIVHVSVTNPSLDSPLPYFRGKAQLEAVLRDSGRSYAIVRPTLVFGPRDILVNNIAWALRRSPVFPVAGDGLHRVQPVAVDDVAAICVDAGESEDELVLDAAGTEVMTYVELVELVRAAVGSRARIVRWPRRAVLASARLAGALHRDVLLTAEELAGLEASLLTSAEPPLAAGSFRSWVAANGESLGRGYVSELARNYRPYDPV
jgi:uncharacterized protein YbjT (DUF2867 family)